VLTWPLAFPVVAPVAANAGFGAAGPSPAGGVCAPFVEFLVPFLFFVLARLPVRLEPEAGGAAASLIRD